MDEKFNCEKALSRLKNWNIKKDGNDVSIFDLEGFLKLLNDLFHEAHKQGFYWEFSTKAVFQSEYVKRLESYLSQYYDGEEVDFIERELSEIHSNYQVSKAGQGSYRHQLFFDISTPDNEIVSIQIPDTLDVFDQLCMACLKKIEFLERKKVVNEGENQDSLHFTGTVTQFTELVKAIIEKGHFTENQKTVALRLSSFLNVRFTGKDFDGLIQDLRSRGDSKYLKELSDTLYNYLNKEK